MNFMPTSTGGYGVEVKLLPKFPFVFRVVFLFLVCASTVFADSSFDYLSHRAEDLKKNNSIKGWGYVISGGVALAVSIPGYYLSEDIFARTIYSLGQTIGVGAVGYGSYLILVDDEIIRFHKVVSAQSTLSDFQKNELAKAFLEETAEQAKRTRHLRALTHGLMAGLNFLNAFTASHSDLRTALFFLGGVNTLVSITSLLSVSDEEKAFQERVNVSLGPNHLAVSLLF